jgi:MYXO-CTERM domain-containing protein
LVVLSACETGVGDVQNGEGVYGLHRAFALAGAESLVMSLWKVDDDATRDLMTGYYADLARGEGRAEGLRKRQLEMLGSGSGARAHPYYWASFVQYGDGAPLGNSSDFRLTSLRPPHGCGCECAGTHSAHSAWMLPALGALFVFMRSRRRRSQRSRAIP